MIKTSAIDMTYFLKQWFFVDDYDQLLEWAEYCLGFGLADV